MRRRALLPLLLLGSGLGCSAEPPAQLSVARSAWVNAVSKPLTPSVDLTTRSFGTVVATDGTSILVSADGDDSSTDGMVVLFSAGADGWHETRVFQPTDQGSLFGRALAVNGDTLAIGGAGVAVYRKSGADWVEETTLPAELLHANFGEALALDQSRMAVGDAESITSDSAFVFERSGASWAQVAQLTPDDTTADVQFGAAVAIRGDVLAVGAPGPVVPPVSGGPLGAVYVYRLQAGSWVQTQKLASSAAEAGDRFGEQLALVGTTLVVGARRSGTIAVFEDTAGSFQETALVSSQVSTVGFGGSIAFDGTTLLAGGGGVSDKGRVETFTREAGAFVAGHSLTELSLAVGTGYGDAVAVAGSVAAVGAPEADGAFAYQLLEGKECTDDLTAVIESSGATTPCAPYFCAAGACATHCEKSTECSVGYVCDTSLGGGQCVAASKGSAAGDDGGCRASRGRPRPVAPWVAACVGLIALSRRRRRAIAQAFGRAKAST